MAAAAVTARVTAIAESLGLAMTSVLAVAAAIGRVSAAATAPVLELLT